MKTIQKTLASLIIVTFFSTSIVPARSFAAEAVLNLPAPGTMVGLTPAFSPLMLKGVKVHPENPVLFDFIVDLGQSGFKADDSLRPQADKLVKYFLASLTTPEKDMWVNLSPYEKDRVVPESLGQTGMGRDMLAQDYLLKQLSASLIHPDKELGKAFWSKVYAKAKDQLGTTEIPMNTFNKIWIMADKAKVFVKDNTAFVVNCHLKVLMEEDYLAMQKGLVQSGMASSNKASKIDVNGSAAISNGIYKELILGEIEKEVNQGESFSTLRQIYHSMILATWYKKNLKEALLNQVYSDRGKTAGITVADKDIAHKIYQQYVQAYRKGVFNFIKDADTTESGSEPRKYFSGGAVPGEASSAQIATKIAELSLAEAGELGKTGLAEITVETQRAKNRVMTPAQNLLNERDLELDRLWAEVSRTHTALIVHYADEYQRVARQAAEVLADDAEVSGAKVAVDGLIESLLRLQKTPVSPAMTVAEADEILRLNNERAKWVESDFGGKKSIQKARAGLLLVRLGEIKAEISQVLDQKEEKFQAQQTAAILLNGKLDALSQDITTAAGLPSAAMIGDVGERIGVLKSLWASMQDEAFAKSVSTFELAYQEAIASNDLEKINDLISGLDLLKASLDLSLNRETVTVDEDGAFMGIAPSAAMNVVEGERTADTVTGPDFKEIIKQRQDGKAGFHLNVDPNPVKPAPITAAIDVTKFSAVEHARLVAEEALMYVKGLIAEIVMVGGEATRFGGPKTFVSIVKELGDFLEVKIANLRWIIKKFGKEVPIYLLSSEKRLLEFKDKLKERKYYGMDPDAYKWYAQGVVDTLIPSDPEIEENFKGNPKKIEQFKKYAANLRAQNVKDFNGDGLYRFNGERRFVPVGHFDAISSFIISGRFSDALSRGIEIAPVFNIDNLQAVLKNDGVMAHFAESGADFGFLLAEKNITFKDIKEEKTGKLIASKVDVRFNDNIISLDGGNTEYSTQAEAGGYRFVINQTTKSVDVFDVTTGLRIDVKFEIKPETGGTLVQTASGEITMKEGFELPSDPKLFKHVDAPLFNTNTILVRLRSLLKFLGVTQEQLAAMSFEERSILVREKLVKQIKANFEFKNHEVEGQFPDLGEVEGKNTKIPVVQLTRIMLQVVQIKGAKVAYYLSPRKNSFAPVKQPEDKPIAAANNIESLREFTDYTGDPMMDQAKTPAMTTIPTNGVQVVIPKGESLVKVLPGRNPLTIHFNVGGSFSSFAVARNADGSWSVKPPQRVSLRTAGIDPQSAAVVDKDSVVDGLTISTNNEGVVIDNQSELRISVAAIAGASAAMNAVAINLKLAEFDGLLTAVSAGLERTPFVSKDETFRHGLDVFRSNFERWVRSDLIPSVKELNLFKEFGAAQNLEAQLRGLINQVNKESGSKLRNVDDHLLDELAQRQPAAPTDDPFIKKLSSGYDFIPGAGYSIKLRDGDSSILKDGKVAIVVSMPDREYSLNARVEMIKGLMPMVLSAAALRKSEEVKQQLMVWISNNFSPQVFANASAKVDEARVRLRDARGVLDTKTAQSLRDGLNDQRDLVNSLAAPSTIEAAPLKAIQENLSLEISELLIQIRAAETPLANNPGTKDFAMIKTKDKPELRTGEDQQRWLFIKTEAATLGLEPYELTASFYHETFQIAGGHDWDAFKLWVEAKKRGENQEQVLERLRLGAEEQLKITSLQELDRLMVGFPEEASQVQASESLAMTSKEWQIGNKMTGLNIQISEERPRANGTTYVQILENNELTSEGFVVSDLLRRFKGSFDVHKEQQDLSSVRGTLDTLKRLVVSSPAMIQREGGIDLNANNLQLSVDGGINIKFDPAMVAEFKRGDFSGVKPVILKVTPMSSVLPLMGLTAADLPQNAQLAGV